MTDADILASIAHVCGSLCGLFVSPITSTISAYKIFITSFTHDVPAV